MGMVCRDNSAVTLSRKRSTNRPPPPSGFSHETLMQLPAGLEETRYSLCIRNSFTRFYRVHWELWKQFFEKILQIIFLTFPFFISLSLHRLLG